MALGGMDGGGGRGRPVDAEINMVPMIDLLVCCITFLILTAVWSTWARLAANANVPGPTTCAECKAEEPRRLHVEARGDDAFHVVWRRGNAVERTFDVPRQAVEIGNGRARATTYPALAEALTRDWAGSPGEARQLEAVVHVDHRAPFREMAGIMDAILKTRGPGAAPAFRVTLAQN